MVLEKAVNHIKHLKSWPLPHLRALVTTFACSGCLFCIQRLFFVSSKTRSFSHDISVGAGFCMCSLARARSRGIARRSGCGHAVGAPQAALVTCCITASIHASPAAAPSGYGFNPARFHSAVRRCLHQIVNPLMNADACVITHTPQPRAMCG